MPDLQTPFLHFVKCLLLRVGSWWQLHAEWRQSRQVPSTRVVLRLSIITMAQQWAMAVPVPSFTSRSARSLFGIAEVGRLGAWALA